MRVEQYGLMCPLADRALRVRGNLDQNPRAREGKWGGLFCDQGSVVFLWGLVLGSFWPVKFSKINWKKRMLLLDTSANFLVCEAFGKKDVVHRQLSGL